MLNTNFTQIHKFGHRSNKPTNAVFLSLSSFGGDGDTYNVTDKQSLYNAARKTSAKVIWQRPHQIHEVNWDSHLTQCSLRLQQSPSQAGPPTVRTVTSRNRQTEHKHYKLQVVAIGHLRDKLHLTENF